MTATGEATYPNARGRPRTVDELRDEYNTVARLHSQNCLAFADANHPNVRAVGRDLDAARDALRRAIAAEEAR